MAAMTSLNLREQARQLILADGIGPLAEGDLEQITELCCEAMKAALQEAERATISTIRGWVHL